MQRFVGTTVGSFGKRPNFFCFFCMKASLSQLLIFLMRGVLTKGDLSPDEYMMEDCPGAGWREKALLSTSSPNIYIRTTMKLQFFDLENCSKNQNTIKSLNIKAQNLSCGMEYARYDENVWSVIWELRSQFFCSNQAGYVATKDNFWYFVELESIRLHAPNKNTKFAAKYDTLNK